MKQTNVIYRYLATTNNETADQALMLGLNAAEEPYRTAILETILDRSRPGATVELVYKYHTYPPAWQEMLHKRIVSLAGGVHRAADSVEVQSRRNALTIIAKTRHAALADTVAAMLKDSDPQIVHLAGNTLMLLTRQVFRSTREEITPEDEQILGVNRSNLGERTEPKVTGGRHSLSTLKTGCRRCETHHWERPDITTTARGKKAAAPGRLSDRQYLLRALHTAIKTWNTHQQNSVLKAAMLAAPADLEIFWDTIFRPVNRMGLAIREMVQSADQKDQTMFCLSALRVPFLRPAVLRAIMQTQSAEFILRLAEALADCRDKDIEQALKKIRAVNWLTPQRLDFSQLPENQQMQLIGFLESLGLESRALENYLITQLTVSNEAVTRRIMETLSGPGQTIPADALQRCLESPYESVALLAMQQVVEQKPPQYRKMIISQLKNRHASVQRQAQNCYKDIAFETYWSGFDRLSPAQQVQAGQAVFKIDPQAADRWRQKTRDEQFQTRLKALGMMRVLRLAGQHEDIICLLASDRHERVRSCAIAALGQIDQPLTDTAQQCLINALRDPDDRVRANAVEVVGRKNITPLSRYITPLADDPNNRVRANAIRILLKWKAQNARSAIKSMLGDARMTHQRSARWLLNLTLAAMRGKPQEPDKPVEPVAFPRYSTLNRVLKEVPEAVHA